MADDNWKTRVGIEINFSSEDEDTQGVSRTVDKGLSMTLSPTSIDSPESSFEGRRFFNDDILSRYAEYGSTPPRTKISRRQRERKQRTDERINSSGAAKSSPRVIHAQAARRNTLDSIYFAELLEKSDLSESPQNQAGSDRSSRVETTKQTSKRAMQLQRGSERDLKLDIPLPGSETDDRAESMPPLMVPQPAIKVETCNRFMSLSSKLVACNKFRRMSSPRPADLPAGQEAASVNAGRQDFFNTFSLLIKMGGGDKQAEKNPRRTISREEQVWQNELKDLIWLELQAWHAGRTLTEQDVFLCQAREGIDTLLNDIMHYRFKRPPPACDRPPPPPDEADDETASTNIASMNVSSSPLTHVKAGSCDGCLSMYCQSCGEAQEAALVEVETLLNRLEAAEALYPSSKVFADKYPLYKSPGLVGRVKAMCLWFNVTQHHRLKLRILGKLLTTSVLEGRGYRWPGEGQGEESGIGSADTSHSEEPAYRELLSVSRSSSVEDRHKSLLHHHRTVQFDVDSGSPSDSNNSNASNGSNVSTGSNVFSGSNALSANVNDVDAQHRMRELYNAKTFTTPGPAIFKNSADPATKNPYRKYIEEVLKTRGLRKALAFLESLHTVVLLKSMLTLEQPRAEEAGGIVNGSLPCMLLDEAETQETRRYGYWSCETQALHLPSYRAAFLFLSRIPLDVIHEFLRMRLEQKPNQPSVLSIRQLMRELKEGLGIAMLHRERYLQLIRAVLWDVDRETLEQFESGVSEYDASVKAVLEVYLEYLLRWVQMVQQETFRKQVLEEEWQFVRGVCPRIKDCEALAGVSFCRMCVSLLSAIGDYLHLSVDQLKSNMDNCEQHSDEDSSPKTCMFSICRDLQSLFNASRVRALKAVSFAKTLRKDLEDDTHHCDAHMAQVADSLQQLKMEALVLCGSIAHTISEVERMCDGGKWQDVDEMDRAALLSRSREILHQAYKFGFEYHKEVHKLVTGESRDKLVRTLISFAKLWMKFVTERCERGRGLRPRWANQGLDFLMYVCEPHLTNCLTDQEFEELKTAMDQCISHVIGQPPSTPDPPSPLPPSPRPSVDYPRSPLPLRSKFRTSRSSSTLGHRRTNSGTVILDENVVDGNIAETLTVPVLALTRHDRVMLSVTNLDRELDKRLRSNDLIGCVAEVDSRDKIHVRLRSVTFGWQRGIKIGQGTYGKVYTAVNNQTGELMAMKEIQLQPNDHRTIRRVAEELRIFEGIKHEHLVRYYGVEIHREEMLIFMEFCAEGTLESLVAGTEGGLPEALIRRYTRQMLQAIATLHKHGIVHRDVKSANIFLTDEGNCLKLGDFGSAVKIKAHTTVPGELQGFVGTQAYMAPEVFMKTTTEGHGRAVDIWSLGCVVVEMASGERPWAEFDSNYQIMFKVGMGETPSIPDTLSEEGTDFLSLCLKHDPRERASANSLLQHPFSKVDADEENLLSLTLPL